MRLRTRDRLHGHDGSGTADGAPGPDEHACLTIQPEHPAAKSHGQTEHGKDDHRVQDYARDADCRRLLERDVEAKKHDPRA